MLFDVKGRAVQLIDVNGGKGCDGPALEPVEDAVLVECPFTVNGKGAEALYAEALLAQLLELRR